MKWKVWPIDNYRGFCYAAEVVEFDEGSYNPLWDIRVWLKDSGMRTREHSNSPIWFFDTKDDVMWFVLTWTT